MISCLSFLVVSPGSFVVNKHVSCALRRTLSTTGFTGKYFDQNRSGDKFFHAINCNLAARTN